jgi:hypothetical protein
MRRGGSPYNALSEGSLLRLLGPRITELQRPLHPAALAGFPNETVTFKINDPETKVPAVKNPFYKPKAGVLPIDDMALDRLLAKGTIVGACNVALTIQSKMPPPMPA